jgi:hypothetical protein
MAAAAMRRRRRRRYVGEVAAASSCHGAVLTLCNILREQQEWEVKRIKDFRVKDGKKQWLVEWGGLDANGEPWEDTWQPMVDFVGNPLLGESCDMNVSLPHYTKQKY